MKYHVIIENCSLAEAWIEADNEEEAVEIAQEQVANEELEFEDQGIRISIDAIKSDEPDIDDHNVNNKPHEHIVPINVLGLDSSDIESLSNFLAGITDPSAEEKKYLVAGIISGSENGYMGEFTGRNPIEAQQKAIKKWCITGEGVHFFTRPQQS